MEIRAQIVAKGSIEYNKQEIEAGLLVLEEKYNGLVFREEDLKEAKEERAKLNKLVKAIDSYRKQVVGEAMEPVKEFETFMKEASKRGSTLSEGIGDQIKEFEKVQKAERLESAKKYIAEINQEKPQYKEFMDQLDLSEAIFTNAGSFNKAGEPGTKLVEYIRNKLYQADEVLDARAVQEKALQEKRELIVSQCASTSKMLGLKIALSPKTFGYLKDYELSKIIDEINRAGQEQQKEEKAAIEKIRLEEEAKAKAEQEKKNAEAQRILEEEKKPKETTVEKVEKIIEPQIIDKTPEPKKEKLFYGVLQFDGITVDQAKMFSKFLKENNIAYTPVKQEVR